MSINLQKGQRIDLTKGNAGLNKILVGLGWDPVETKSSGGFLSGLFGGGGSTSPNIDCDASVLMLKNDKIVANSDVIYFGNLKSANGAVAHSGDNLTGAGDGDDEQIVVELNSIPAEYMKLERCPLKSVTTYLTFVPRLLTSILPRTLPSFNSRKPGLERAIVSIAVASAK